MEYEIRFLSSAERQLEKFPRPFQERVAAAVDRLSADPRTVGAKRLTSDDPLYRIRIGDYRILYAIDDTAHVVTVVYLGHRREVYRGI